MIHRRPAALAAICAALALAASTYVAAQAQERVIYVTALDRDGAPVEALSPDDIVVREDGTAREVLRIAPAVEPMHIALLVDNSTAAEPFIRDYRQALVPFVQALMGNEPGLRNEVALITLAERPTIVANYTPDPEPILNGVRRLFSQPQSGTYLLDGIIEVSQGIMKRAPQRPVIVAIVTDGPDLSQRMYQQVLEPLLAGGAAFHVIIVGTPRNMEHDRSVVLDRGTKETGGSYETLLTGTALENHLKKFANQLTHQFRVTYARPRALIPPEDITVTAARPALTVRGTPEVPPRELGR
jgi:hypothetical protein